MFDDLPPGVDATRWPTSRERRRNERRAAPPSVVARVFGDSKATRVGVIALTAVVGLLIVRPVVMSLLSYHRTSHLLAERQSQVAQLSAEHDLLQKQIAYYSTPEYVMERAREYGLVRSGEVPWVVRDYDNPGNYGQAQAETDMPPPADGTPEAGKIHLVDTPVKPAAKTHTAAAGTTVTSR